MPCAPPWFPRKLRRTQRIGRCTSSLASELVNFSTLCVTTSTHGAPSRARTWRTMYFGLSWLPQSEMSTCVTQYSCQCALPMISKSMWHCVMPMKVQKPACISPVPASRSFEASKPRRAIGGFPTSCTPLICWPSVLTLYGGLSTEWVCAQGWSMASAAVGRLPMRRLKSDSSSWCAPSDTEPQVLSNSMRPWQILSTSAAPWPPNGGCPCRISNSRQAADHTSALGLHEPNLRTSGAAR
mmetsp:Transcript_59719/g.153790  ORF Transcript_59719/g.153790 Transcript_59719/m.153790 type:complete len:240 (-) Transcript_59719:1030-1749(-)